MPGLPHHVTQRGNRHETVFFPDAEYRAYPTMLIAAVDKAVCEVRAWCSMPNHVHLTGDEEFTALRRREIVGRPSGDDQFLVSFEARLGQTPRRK